MKAFSRFIAVIACTAATTLAGCATVDLGPDTGAPVRMPGGGSGAAVAPPAPSLADDPPVIPAQTMPVAPDQTVAQPLSPPDDGTGNGGGRSAGDGADSAAIPGPAPVPTALPPPSVAAPNVNAQLVTLTARADGPSAVPPTLSPATAQIDLIYDANTHLLRWKAGWSGLSSPITGIRFHGPAAQGQPGPATMIWPGPFGSRYEGRATLTPQQVTDLMGGLWYVNISTANYPDGEMRGQVRVVY